MAGVMLRRVAGILPNALCKAAPGRVCSWQARNARSYSLSRHLHAELKFTKDHEWVSVDNGIATVGVSDYAQEKLGDIVFIQLPEIGDHFEKDADLAVLESVKAASDLLSPLSGKVTDINTSLEEKPSKVNDSPYDEGWIVKMEVDDPKELDGHLDEKAYKEFIGTLEE